MFTLYSKPLNAVKTTLHSCIVYNVFVHGAYIIVVIKRKLLVTLAYIYMKERNYQNDISF